MRITEDLLKILGFIKINNIQGGFKHPIDSLGNYFVLTEKNLFFRGNGSITEIYNYDYLIGYLKKL